MPSPYTIEQTAEMSGLSIKFIRRLKSALPTLFEKHTERGVSNALLFDEEIIEVLKRTSDLKKKGRTLQQIRDELAEVAAKHKEGKRTKEAVATATAASEAPGSPRIQPAESVMIPLTESLRRENQILRNENDLLKNLLKKSEERFDRLLPMTTTPPATPEKAEGKPTFRQQLLLWLVEAVVVTAFAAGFIFLIWLFAQRAFSL